MRITGGTLRSRSLSAPRGTATRPTSDRVREALFDILTSARAVESARVLDLYAGTGALSLEALSRGALHATLVESSSQALRALRSNVAALSMESRTHIVAADVRAFIARLAHKPPFDLVLADPPWALVDAGDVVPLLAALAQSGAVADGTTIVLEHAARSPPPEAVPLIRSETRRYGDTALSFYKPAILGATHRSTGSSSE